MGCDIHYYLERRSWPSEPTLRAFVKGLAELNPRDRVGPLVLADMLDERGETVAAAEARTLDAAGVLRKLAPWSYLREFSKDVVRRKHMPDGADYNNDAYDRYFSDPLYVGRDYELFGRLAGVRREQEPVVCPPKGFPTDASPEVFAEFTLLVVDEPRPTGVGEDATCSPERAAGWIRTGSSQWVIEGKIITHPDWHTPSWLTITELFNYRRRHGRGKFWEVTLPLWADAAKGGSTDDVRVVFWFDN